MTERRKAAACLRDRLVPALLALLLGLPIAGAVAEEPPLEGRLAGRFSLSAAPQPAPPTQFTDGSGRSLGLGAFRGRVVVLNFWATWCPACVVEMPSLDRLQNQMGGEGLKVVAVSRDRGGRSAVDPFFERYGLSNLDTYLDTSGELSREFGIRKLPTTVLIGPDGRVLGRMVGAYEWDSAAAKKLFRHYLRGGGSTQTAALGGASGWTGIGGGEDAFDRGDYAAAFRDWSALAAQGDAAAQYNLAYLYDAGLGVPQDQRRAADWYAKAALQGDSDALYNLAAFFANGEGVAQDFVVACLLFDVAAVADPAAAEQRDVVADYMTSAQIDEANRLLSAARRGDALTVVRRVLAEALGPGRPTAAPGLVKEVQAALTAIGYDAGPADGLAGGRTRQAIRAFQSDAGLTVDGVASAELLERLQTARAP